MSKYKNPIEREIESVDLTDSFFDAVGEETFRATKMIFVWLQRQGYVSPILFGGALRDMYLGENTPYDFDVDVCNPLNHHHRIIGEAPKSIVLDISSRSFSRQHDTPQDIALRADAPINAIAMTKRGRVFAHPDFEEHAKSGIYRIRTDLNFKQRYLAESRFDHLRERYSHLEKR